MSDVSKKSAILCGLNKNKSDIFNILFILIICGGLCSFLSLRTMPFAEGWYSYYASRILSGDKVYKDFEYLFTPFYMYFIAGVTRIVGFRIIYLRILGIIIYVSYAILYYYISKEFVQQRIAMVFAITISFFVQSVNVNVFYDYIKLMDIFSMLSVLFMIKSIKDGFSGKSIYFWGLGTFLFVLCKQNMGLIFWAYSLFAILVFSFFIQIDNNDCTKAFIFRSILRYNLPILIGTGVFFLLLSLNGSVDDFYNSCFKGAAEAKGGIGTILFGWLNNGGKELKRFLIKGIIFGVVTAIAVSIKQKKEIKVKYCSCFFIFVAIIGIACSMRKREVGEYFASKTTLSPYFLFMCIVPMTLVLFGTVVLEHKIKYLKVRNVDFLALLGASISISYGAATSGGLSVSESGLMLLSFMYVIYYLVGNYLRGLTQYIIILWALFIVMVSSSYKMVHTYYWWYQSEASVYECVTESKVPLLKGIRLSEDTANVYDSIFDDIMQLTSDSDKIYCFPQIPYFYLMTNRSDPGVYSKVQWFDVSTNEAIVHDEAVISKSDLKAILIYDVDSKAYQSHKDLFGSSATMNMREYLYNYMFNNGFSLYKRYNCGSNNLSLYIRNMEQRQKKVRFEGEGTSSNPFQISSIDDLKEMAFEVRQGRDFKDQYFVQTKDIDCTDEVLECIGHAETMMPFNGIYDGQGHIISNYDIRLTDDYFNCALFGYFGGELYNLVVKDAAVTAANGAGLVSHSYGQNAKICNCCVNAIIDSYERSGAFADNFNGVVDNCVFYGELKGRKAEAVSYCTNRSTLGALYVEQQAVNREYVCGTEMAGDGSFYVEDITDPVYTSLLNSKVVENSLYCKWENDANTSFPTLVRRE